MPNSIDPFSELHGALQQRADAGLLRQRVTVASPQTPHLLIDGKSYLAFCSNDYLGLACHPQLIAALQQHAGSYGVGAAAAHLVNGHHILHEQLEQRLAAFVGKPAAVLFSTGYMANLGVVEALVGKGDTVFADKLNHASLNQAMLASRATVKRYRHGDLPQLAKQLAATPAGRKLIITDAVFSMDGDIADLPALLALCEQYDAWLLVDDAHGFGVLGSQGRGSLAHFCLQSPRIIYMATLGKAAGVFGAFVAAETVVIQTLINFAPSYVYTTATPPALAGALLASVDVIEQADTQRAHLACLIQQLRSADLPWPLMPSNTAIQPLLLQDSQAALRVSAQLREQGIWVAAIRPPTVPQGTARLRITLSAAHSEQDVAQLVSALQRLGERE